MKKVIIALLIACACVTACSSADNTSGAKARSTAAETLPAENK